MIKLRSHVSRRLLLASRSSLKLTPAQKAKLTPQELKVLAAHERTEFHKNRQKWTLRLAVLALTPMLMLFFDAKYFVKKLDLPRRAQNYKKRLRKEHNIDHEGLLQAYKELDQRYGVSEKEEIEEMKQLGFGPRDTLAMKQHPRAAPAQPAKDEQISKNTIRIENTEEESQMSSLQDLTGKQGDILVSSVQGKNFQRTEIQQDMQVPDPRIGGAKIMFDSRFDELGSKPKKPARKETTSRNNQPKIKSFEELGGKKAECAEKGEEGKEESLKNEAYSAAKESFRSKSLDFSKFQEIKNAVENFKNQWKRENLYQSEQERRDHNEWITWLACGLEKEGVKLEDELIWFLFFRSYENAFKQIEEPSQFYPSVPCQDIPSLLKETQQRMYKEHLWMIKAESYGLLDEAKTRQIQIRVSEEVNKVIQDIQRLQNQYLVKDNERRIGILEQLNVLFEELMAQESERAKQAFKQQTLEVEETFERGRVLMESKMKKKADYQNMIKWQINVELREHFNKGELPQQLIARDINGILGNIEGAKQEARDSLVRLHLFEELWNQDNNASLFEENKKQFVTLAEKVIQQRPSHAQSIQNVLGRLELCCPGSRIPGVGKILSEFKTLRQDILTSKGTERSLRIFQDMLQWIRRRILPHSLLMVNCRAQAAVLRKIENALRRREFELVKRLLEENEVRAIQKQEMLREGLPRESREKLNSWEQQMRGLLARREVAAAVGAALLR